MEIIIGSKRYDDFGQLIVFGLGGIYTEILKDVSFGLAPLGRSDARRMISEIKSKAILEGARGGLHVNMELLENTLLLVSNLVTEFPQIKEIDINPFTVGPQGTTPIAVDAMMTLENN